MSLLRKITKRAGHSVQRMVRTSPGTQNPRRLNYQRLTENLATGKCGLQSLLRLMETLEHSSKARKDGISRQFPGFRELLSLWISSGHPMTGLWRDIMLPIHSDQCSCFDVSSRNGPNDPSSAKPPTGGEK